MSDLITDPLPDQADRNDFIQAMRERLKENRVLNPQYDTMTRSSMKNSLTMSPEEVEQKIANGDPYVIRIKVPEKEEVRLNDMVRGWVMVHTEAIDDKVIMKSDGMPTYHLANVVDDHLMKITHVIRGEEWLPSAPLHPRHWSVDYSWARTRSKSKRIRCATAESANRCQRTGHRRR